MPYRYLIAPRLYFLSKRHACGVSLLSPLVKAMEQDFQAGAAGGTICYYPEKEIWYQEENSILESFQLFGS